MTTTIIAHEYNGFEVGQRPADGYMNLTAMAKANGKLIADYLRLDSTKAFLEELSESMGYPIDSLIQVKTGRNGGTWGHPRVAINCGQWCSAKFAALVSGWIFDWMTTGQNPIHQAISDRLQSRLALQQVERARFADEIKAFLVGIQKYDDHKYSGQFFAKVHDSLNRLITGETSREMKQRLQDEMGVKVDEKTLIRDYFPIEAIELYRAMCRTATNFMYREQMHPLKAVLEAARMALPYDHEAKPIDFELNIKRLAVMKGVLQLKSFD